MFRRLGCIFALVVMLLGVPCDSWMPALQSQGKAAKPQEAAIDINKATANDLQKLPGIGPSLAKQIVAYREKHGPFRRVEDLMAIRGIGFKKWKQIRPYVRVGDRYRIQDSGFRIQKAEGRSPSPDFALVPGLSFVRINPPLRRAQ